MNIGHYLLVPVVMIQVFLGSETDYLIHEVVQFSVENTRYLDSVMLKQMA